MGMIMYMDEPYGGVTDDASNVRYGEGSAADALSEHKEEIESINENLTNLYQYKKIQIASNLDLHIYGEHICVLTSNGASVTNEQYAIPSTYIPNYRVYTTARDYNGANYSAFLYSKSDATPGRICMRTSMATATTVSQAFFTLSWIV